MTLYTLATQLSVNFMDRQVDAGASNRPKVIKLCLKIKGDELLHTFVVRFTIIWEK
jgi:hypothetical protein